MKPKQRTNQLPLLLVVDIFSFPYFAPKLYCFLRFWLLIFFRSHILHQNCIDYLAFCCWYFFVPTIFSKIVFLPLLLVVDISSFPYFAPKLYCFPRFWLLIFLRSHILHQNCIDYLAFRCWYFFVPTIFSKIVFLPLLLVVDISSFPYFAPKLYCFPRFWLLIFFRSHILHQNCIASLDFGCWYFFPHCPLHAGRIFFCSFGISSSACMFDPMLVSF